MSDSILTLPPPPYDLLIRYGDAPQQFAEVRFPPENDSGDVVHTNGPYRGSAVFFIHGGYWRAKYDLNHAGHFCAALTKTGSVTINIEYRRVGDPGGGWPGTMDDVARAFDYVVEHADELRIAARRICAMGHSAGGQLALWLAARRPHIARAVSLAGVLDLRRAWELHLSNDAVVGLLGGTPEQVPERYRQASPIELTVGNVEQLVVHGTADADVPIDLSRRYAMTKMERGERVRYVEVNDADHFDLIDARHSCCCAVIEEITT